MKLFALVLLAQCAFGQTVCDKRGHVAGSCITANAHRTSLEDRIVDLPNKTLRLHIKDTSGTWCHCLRCDKLFRSTPATIETTVVWRKKLSEKERRDLLTKNILQFVQRHSWPRDYRDPRDTTARDIIKQSAISSKTYTPWYTPYYPYVPHQCSCLDSLTEAWYQYQVWLAKPGNYDRDIGPMENYSFWKFMEYRKFVEFTKKRKK